MMHLALIICFALAAFSAKADGMDANTMFKWCISADDTRKSYSCHMYIAGFLHGAAMALKGTEAELGGDTSRMRCLPKNFTGAEGEAIFLRTMRTTRNLRLTPAFGDLNIDQALTLAFDMAFPCKPPN
jgi:hypothetical protein